MTKPQIWIASFVFLFLLLFILNQATKKEEEVKNPIQNTVPQTGMNSEENSGEQLVKRLGCISCHGSDLKGSRMGPDLTNVKEFWSRDQLINYLRNPNSYMQSERMQKYKENFPGVIMPPFNHVDVKDLGKIAEYLLELNKK